ncbi:hypothetical protein ONZ43_g6010 [Nemania bipapillata]|uniref:Uncharacterized protein n=1 Tax=Nemania bipapillata TaxID=110536 RepID=A0ACC2I3P0_9PEZI|nr:hypothetical protein ONZ43_g6010 [Nemania bipapillata]
MQFTTLTLAAISIVSAIAAPSAVARSDPKILTSAISEVSDTRSAVDNQVAIIKNLVQTTVNSAVVPALQASLQNIAGEITSVTSFVKPLVTDVALPLAQAELDNLPGFVADVQAIAGDVQDAANVILAGLSQQTLGLVKSEVLLVLATVNPFVQPVIQFANSAIVGASGPSTDSVQTAVATTQVIVGQIVGPITAAYTKIN